MHTQHRVEKVRTAKTAVEAAAARRARTEPAPSDRPRRGRPAKNPPGTPPARAPRNCPDPDSRIMQARDGCIHGYHAHAAVAAAQQVIVAPGLTNQARAAHQLTPMRAHSKANTGRQARELSAETGYCSEHNLTALPRHHVRGSGATGRQQHGAASAVGGRTTVPKTRVHAMKIRLRRAGPRRRERLRKQVGEPGVGQSTQARGFRQFLLRGLSQVAGAWRLVCRAHTVLQRAGARG